MCTSLLVLLVSQAAADPDYCLQRMRRQQQAADRKAQAEGKKAAAAAQSSAEAASNDADAEDGTPAQASKGKKRGAANKAGGSSQACHLIRCI